MSTNSDPNELVPRSGPDHSTEIEAYTFRLSVVDESGMCFELECAPTVFTNTDPDDDSYVLSVGTDGINQ